MLVQLVISLRINHYLNLTKQILISNPLFDIF